MKRHRNVTVDVQSDAQTIVKVSEILSLTKIDIPDVALESIGESQLSPEDEKDDNIGKRIAEDKATIQLCNAEVEIISDIITQLDEYRNYLTDCIAKIRKSKRKVKGHLYKLRS